MSVAAKLSTSAVAAAAAVAIWFYVGRDPEGFVQFVSDNGSELILGIQIVVMFILASTKHYLAGAALLVTSVATLFGVVL